MKTSRGVARITCGTKRGRAILSDRNGASPGHLGKTFVLSLTPDGGFASIMGSEVWHRLRFYRLFDIVI